MNRLVLGIGSNTPEAETNVRNAVCFLSGQFPNLIHSSIYRTDPEGDALPGTRYHNAVAAASTSLSIEDVVTILKNYESAHGRTAALKQKGIIPIDIDLVIYGDNILRPHEIHCNYFLKGAEELNIL